MGPAGTDAGVVADDVDAAEVAPNAACDLFHLRQVAHVAAVATNIDVGGVELGVGFRQRILLHIEHRHMRPSTGQRPRHAEANARRRTRHHRDLVLNRLHYHTSPIAPRTLSYRHAKRSRGGGR